MNKTFLKGAAGALGLGAVALISAYQPVSAHNYSSDLACQITDNSGQVNQYTFADNTHNLDGSLGGTMVETGYANWRKAVVSPAGARPIWFYVGNALGGLTLASREAPGWAIEFGAGGQAVLMHGRLTVGSGTCARSSFGTAATVPDVAPE
jgi:hypothetical protein